MLLTFMETPSCPSTLESRILLLVIVDIKSKRLVGLKIESFEKLLRTAQYFCGRSFATWDVLPPSQNLAVKLSENCITTKFFRLQSEYMGTHRIHVTLCHVPAILPGNVVASFLSAYDRVEEVTQLRALPGQHTRIMCSEYALIGKTSKPSRTSFSAGIGR